MQQHLAPEVFGRFESRGRPGRIRPAASHTMVAGASLFNHPNFAQPNRTVTSADFGKITATRTTRGDLGSSRQLQLGLKFVF